MKMITNISLVNNNEFDNNYSKFTIEYTISSTTLSSETTLLVTTAETTIITSPSIIATGSVWLSLSRLQISLYILILLLAVIGNLLVIMTLVQNLRMRTITNVFLMNLAFSDLLLGVFCMPFTLIGTLLRDFVFGELMCKIIPYLQASSVAVSAWTLVALSFERYYAICHPLSSRRWQTINHAYKLIGLIWFFSLFCMLPIAMLSHLKPTSQGHRKCRESWPDVTYERLFNIFLDFILLIIPLIALATTYTSITRTLWEGMKSERQHKKQTTCDSNESSNNLIEVYTNCEGRTNTKYRSSFSKQQLHENALMQQPLNDFSNESPSVGLKKKKNPGLRQSNAEKSLQNKRHVIQMLFVVVLEFFICWTPLYVINTITLFNATLVYQNIGYIAISFFQLLAYTSSCCNPITYCFMNRGFRKAFLNLFGCFKRNYESRRMSNCGWVGGVIGVCGTGGGGGGGGVGGVGFNDNTVTQMTEMPGGGGTRLQIPMSKIDDMTDSGSEFQVNEKLLN